MPCDDPGLRITGWKGKPPYPHPRKWVQNPPPERPHTRGAHTRLLATCSSSPLIAVMPW